MQKIYYTVSYNFFFEDIPYHAMALLEKEEEKTMKNMKCA